MSDAKISFDQRTGAIIAEWPTHTDKIHCGIVYLTVNQAKEAEDWGWKTLNVRTRYEIEKGLVKVKKD